MIRVHFQKNPLCNRDENNNKWSKQFDRHKAASPPHTDGAVVSTGGANVHPIHRKPKMVAMATYPMCKVSVITAFCRQTTQPSPLPIRYRPHKASYSNFSPKIGCHGNNPWTFDADYIFFG